MAKLNKTVIAALLLIQSTGTVTAAVGKPLVEQGLIEVNQDDVNGNVDPARARLTQKAIDGMPAKDKAVATAVATPAATITLLSGIVLPERKRGFGRTAQPSIWPFATMEVGQSFFVGNSSVKDGDAFKKMSSNVSNANNKYRTATGESRSVTRKKKGGNGEMETVTLPKYKQDRKFVIHAVTKDQKLGEWTALEDGAIVARIAVAE